MMTNRLEVTKLAQLFAQLGLEVKPAQSALEEWDQVLGAAADVPVAYTLSMVGFLSEYIAEKSDEFHDLSVVIYHDNKAAAVWPLCIRQTHGTWICGSNAGNVISPLFAAWVARKSQKSILRKSSAAITEICWMYASSTWSACTFLGPQGASLWHRRVMEDGGIIQSIQHLMYVDLSLELDAIKVYFRDSYKNLITQGLKRWSVEVLTAVSPRGFEEFKNLHEAIAGRVTRSKRSWDLQEQAINNSQAFLVTLRDGGYKMIGGGLFHVSRVQGLYAVAAYDRNLPLGHVVQWKAIEHMKTLGLRWYRIGERPFREDGRNTAKQVNIGRFKEGFATHIFLELEVARPRALASDHGRSDISTGPGTELQE